MPTIRTELKRRRGPEVEKSETDLQRLRRSLKSEDADDLLEAADLDEDEGVLETVRR